MTENQEVSSGICQHCFLFAAQMEKHLLEEHGIKPSAEREAELREKRIEEQRKITADSKLDMVYIGDGPTQPK